ncbi:hypothetical protein [Pseudoxanthomonas mexicana]|uniref:hypothetical protein n=1 Tax=Pseudoxanthomonas mexicana TaxID=128785 RepID=UPI0012ECFF19|nr:hypothetical protein [Pseudoxanthomonas mexicana]
MNSNIILLTDLSYGIGLIGVAEYLERMKVADWLSESNAGMRDPRLESPEEEPARRKPELPKGEGAASGSGSSGGQGGDEDSSPYMQFLALKTWMFTAGDHDCYPSVPHGHFQRKTNKWPKLNPYIGRVFSGMHTENVSARLTRTEMKALWSDDDGPARVL